MSNKLLNDQSKNTCKKRDGLFLVLPISNCKHPFKSLLPCNIVGLYNCNYCNFSGHQDLGRTVLLNKFYISYENRKL